MDRCAADSASRAERSRTVKTLVRLMFMLPLTGCYAAPVAYATPIYYSAYPCEWGTCYYDGPRMVYYERAPVRRFYGGVSVRYSETSYIVTRGATEHSHVDRSNGLTKKTGRGRSVANSMRAMLRQDEWLVSDLAIELDMSYITLYAWLGRGWVHGRQPTEHVRRPWAIRADAAELARLRALRAAPKLGWRSPQWIASA
jgi:hypothetical protein